MTYSDNSLQEHLSNLLFASLEVHQAHWNVRGSNFSGLHELFGEVYDALSEQADSIAERLAQKGVSALGRCQDISSTTTLKSLIGIGHDNDKMCKVITATLVVLSKHAVDLFEEATKAGDHITANILIDHAQELDKLRWKVVSHIQ